MNCVLADAKKSKLFWRTIGTLVWIILPVLGSSAAIAKEIYVATNGNDNNDGTRSKPLASIQTALDRAVAGDTVYVRKGTYFPNQRLKIYQSGTATSQIQFKAFPNESVILDGTKIQGSNRDVLSLTGDYINVEGFEIRNSQKHGIIVWSASNVRVAGNKIYNNYEGGINSYYSSNVLMENNTVYRTNFQNKSTGRWSKGIGAGFSENITIQGNRIYENYGEGTGCFLTKGCRIQKNTLNDNFSVEIYLDHASEAVVDSNFVFNKRLTEFYRDKRPAAGIQLANENHSNLNPINNVTISNNIVTETWRCFFYGNYHQGGGLKNVSFVNNTCAGSTSNLIQIDQDPGHFNTLFVNNIFFQKSGISLSNVPAVNGITFSSNLWWGGSPTTLVRSSIDVLANPSFMKAGGSTAADYKLMQQSPAINKGQLLNLTRDFFGGLRPNTGNQDIGAHEFGAVVRMHTPRRMAQKQAFKQIKPLRKAQPAKRGAKPVRRVRSWLIAPKNIGY
jgi:parallel beta-helix repeat protein